MEAQPESTPMIPMSLISNRPDEKDKLKKHDDFLAKFFNKSSYSMDSLNDDEYALKELLTYIISGLNDGFVHEDMSNAITIYNIFRKLPVKEVLLLAVQKHRTEIVALLLDIHHKIHPASLDLQLTKTTSSMDEALVQMEKLSPCLILLLNNPRVKPSLVKKFIKLYPQSLAWDLYALRSMRNYENFAVAPHVSAYSVYSTEEVSRVYMTLLMNASPIMVQGMEFSSSDKDELVAYFKVRIAQVKKLDQLEKLQNLIEKNPVLNYRRHETYDQFKAKFFSKGKLVVVSSVSNLLKAVENKRNTLPKQEIKRVKGL